VKKKKIIYNIIIVVLALIFVGSAFMLGSYILETRQEKDRFDELAQLVQSATVPTLPPTEPTQPADVVTEPTEPEPTESPWVQVAHPKTGELHEVLPEYAELFRMNGDVVGWLEIPGTVINYPVMQTPDRRDYYLRRNFDGKYATGGCLYAREECDIFRPSDNITIYGHRMQNGSMFADLGKYKEESFAKEHSIVYFNTLRERHTYQVYAVFLTDASWGKGFQYHNYIDALEQSVFDNFTSTCKELSLFDTGVEAEFGDKFITLSTCDYYTTNGRLVVVAKRIS